MTHTTNAAKTAPAASAPINTRISRRRCERWSPRNKNFPMFITTILKQEQPLG
jgi:hypothetical protein